MENVVKKKRENQRVALLSQSILPVVLQVALPTSLAVMIPITVSIVGLYFLGMLGTETVAAVSLVFPVATVVQMISSGDIGGAISGAMARSLGAGKRDDANALVLQSLLLSIVFGLICAVLQMTLAPDLYRLLGASERVVEIAVAYSNPIFIGSVFMWTANHLAGVLRGSGDVSIAARTMITARIATCPLYPALIFGWGPLPSLGVAGAAFVDILYFGLSSVALILFLLRPGNSVQLTFEKAHLRCSQFFEILRVGGMLTIRTAQSAITTIVVAANVGALGSQALAGYGAAARLDAALAPLLFGLGTSTLLMTGTNLGAGQTRRAYRSAFAGIAFAAAFIEIIGIVVAIFPSPWMRLFSNDPDVIEQGSAYLRIVGPLYGLFAAGVMIYFVAQATKYLKWNLAAATARLVVVVVGCYVANLLDAGLKSISLVVAFSYLIFGIVNLMTMFPRAGWHFQKS